MIHVPTSLLTGMVDLFRSLVGTSLPTIDNSDYRPLARHPHFKTLVMLEPHYPDDGPDDVRSWFGGAPQMPPDIPWPKDNDGRPCLFLAQICCADLPSRLWGGIGPREGWLLFFIAAEDLDLRVIHCQERGPEMFEDCGLDSTYWEWNRRVSCKDGSPRFRKFPVRPVAQTMPSDLALPNREQREAPPLRPRTWGQLSLMLSWLEREIAPPQARPAPQTPVAPASRAYAEAQLASEPKERRTRREAAEAHTASVEIAHAEAKAQQADQLNIWLSKAASRRSADPLGDTDWSDFLGWALRTERAIIKRTVVEPEVPAEFAHHAAPYCLWWRPFQTKADYRAMASVLDGFKSAKGFKTGQLKMLQARKSAAEAGRAVWNDTLEAQLKREAEIQALDDAEAAGLRSYLKRRNAFVSMIRTFEETDRINPDQMQDFVTAVRSAEHFAAGVEVVRHRIPAVVESTLTFEGPLVPGLTADGLVPTLDTKAVHDAIGQALLDDFWSGHAAPDAIVAARAHAEQKLQPGRTMGGLPFFGHDPNLMDLQAYASPKQRATMDDPMYRAVYGDPEKMEPQCLLLNLGSYDPVGWLWGDCYTLTIHMPRADLEAGRFDRVTGYIDNG